ncbi:MAG: hypothetical protein P1V51_14370, partial [Deltaproteobacteria bacterium]|nr:hypothetical protein [Deltaproteobacteria bacterium]
MSDLDPTQALLQELEALRFQRDAGKLDADGHRRLAELEVILEDGPLEPYEEEVGEVTGAFDSMFGAPAAAPPAPAVEDEPEEIGFVDADDVMEFADADDFALVDEAAPAPEPAPEPGPSLDSEFLSLDEDGASPSRTGGAAALAWDAVSTGEPELLSLDDAPEEPAATPEAPPAPAPPAPAPVSTFSSPFDAPVPALETVDASEEVPAFEESAPAPEPTPELAAFPEPEPVPEFASFEAPEPEPIPAEPA